MTPRRRRRDGGGDDRAALLLLLLLLRPPALQGITCPTPTSVEHADIRVKSYNVNSRERYTCILGFKRKAGTSSLTECMLDKATNLTYWTTPNLKCIRDPSLTHQMPVSPSTVASAGMTPEAQSPTPSGKEPEAFTPKSDTTVTTETAIVPGSRLMPPQPPAGTTGVVSNGSSQGPPQTTAKTLEQTPSASQETPGAHPYNSRAVAVAIPTSTISVILLSGICAALFLARCKKNRSPSQTPRIEMENMEDTPMTGGTGSIEEDLGNYPCNL
ncbi:interleukin-15 receptor subunit alpha isoform X1 [Dasypus novemcinctus]|uniref:interleukin-15 receptor subunit alpha isoform X1 n=1 Tax=Dasypus novemcinctus TaxID=9361 RepID=UPI00265DB963|nr:interleukin-15 receptor subunit alpha isoform X1 [Dasypus novemcinctus]